MSRTVLRLSGPDSESFLQGLVTNDVRRLRDGPVYAALLTPQGKYLFDFILVADGDTILIDVAADRAADLARRLAMYRLRAKVAIEVTDLGVTQGSGTPPQGAVRDPRHPELGWRMYAPGPGATLPGWDALRIAHLIPETGAELVPDETYILEAGFERLNGVDFRKGCYVGQEVTARMKHKTDLRKGLVRVAIAGPAPAPGTPVLTADGREAGTIQSVAGSAALAHLRFDRASGDLSAGQARITVQA
jgi:folate-binding protein YgfZ